jgi:hypothetical protein
VIFFITYAIETLTNKWDARWTKNNEGVHSLGWEGQEEERWRKFRIFVGEYQWVVGLSELSVDNERHPLFWIHIPSLRLTAIEI